MKAIIVITLLLFSLNSTAQTPPVNDKQISQNRGVQPLFSNKTTTDIDFAEEKKFWGHTMLKALEKKARTFNITINTINYIVSVGCSLIQAYQFRRNNMEIFQFALNKLVY